MVKSKKAEDIHHCVLRLKKLSSKFANNGLPSQNPRTHHPHRKIRGDQSRGNRLHRTIRYPGLHREWGAVAYEERRGKSQFVPALRLAGYGGLSS